MKVYPVAGLLLRDPVKGDFVPAEGREVEDSPFWFRRLACGDAALTPSLVAAAPVVLPEPVLESAPAEAPEIAAESLEAGTEPASAGAAVETGEGA